MALERGVDPLEALGVAEDVLRHPARPAVDPDRGGLRRRRRASASSSRASATSSSSGSRRDVAPAEPPEVDADQDATVRRAALPLARRPRAGEHVRALGARDDVAVARRAADTSSRANASVTIARRRVRDLRVPPRSSGSSSARSSAVDECGSREHDAVGVERLAASELDRVASRRRRSCDRARGRVRACVRSSVVDDSASTSVPIPARRPTNGGSCAPVRGCARSPRSRLPCSSSSARRASGTSPAARAARRRRRRSRS